MTDESTLRDRWETFIRGRLGHHPTDVDKFQWFMRQIERVAPRKKFEYQIVSRNEGADARTGIQHFLSAKGQDGWELVTKERTEIDNADVARWHTFYFKREIVWKDRYAGMSNRKFRKAVTKEIRQDLKHRIRVFVRKGYLMCNPGHARRTWAVFLWPDGTPRNKGVMIECWDRHNLYIDTLEYVVDHVPHWLNHR